MNSFNGFPTRKKAKKDDSVSKILDNHEKKHMKKFLIKECRRCFDTSPKRGDELSRNMARVETNNNKQAYGRTKKGSPQNEIS
ncbi:hypothetical protein Bca52824_017108 [Brassica carinata]|uniref:Uncharacterized protein n=1 Tax=Brassica carinata TaxID=52824 RepID=A0A8X7VMJ1_BRACI|nr:hypothetical protein Bca52824_017108 [Brassica carinata]